MEACNFDKPGLPDLNRDLSTQDRENIDEFDSRNLSGMFLMFMRLLLKPECCRRFEITRYVKLTSLIYGH